MRATGISVLRVVLGAALSVALLGCGNKDEKKPAPKQEPQAKPDEANKKPPRPPAFMGQLTYARMEKAKASVKPGDPWEHAFDLVQAEAGKPTKVDGVDHKWYLLEGDKCHELALQTDDTNVGSVSLGTYDKIMKAKYDNCLPPAPTDTAPPEIKIMGGGGGEVRETDKTDEGGW
jgi:hypothetical protein